MTGYPETHRTLINLIGLQPQLPPVVRRALQITTVGFSVYQGVRSADEQKADVAAGKSKTLKSRHLTGHAVDFYAVVNGKAEWNDPHPYCQIALSFKQASIDLNTPLTWGGCWDVRVADLSDNQLDDVAAYRARQAALGNLKPLIDLDHVELDRHTYP